MDVKELFDQLATGELQNLSIAEGGSISVAARPKLFRYLNQGLMELYSRFVLKENDCIVQLYDHITFYHLVPRFAVNYTPEGEADTEVIRYIIDLPNEPFKDEVIKVTAISDSTGAELTLNDELDRYSVFTPQAKMLQVSNPNSGRFLSVRYQQRHPKLQGDLGELIECPDVLVEPLTSFVAYKVFSHMNSADSNAKSQEFLAMFERGCNEAVDRDLVSSSVSQINTRFAQGGWV